jgi:site-specific recombinase XerD
MEKLIHSYLESKIGSWEQTTIRSEGHRLNKHAAAALSAGPAAYYQQLSTTAKPYTTKTIFTRIGEFVDWMIEHGHMEGPNSFKLFVKNNRKVFKNAYQKEQLDVTFAEAKERIEAIKDVELREKALQLLLTGARWSESFTLKDGQVVGKGRKIRRLFNATEASWAKSYRTFLQRLKEETGLKPHSLRKLFATNLVEQGASEADLLKIMGWSSIITASSYLQSKKDSELELFIKRATA